MGTNNGSNGLQPRRLRGREHLHRRGRARERVAVLQTPSTFLSAMACAGAAGAGMHGARTWSPPRTGRRARAVSTALQGARPHPGRGPHGLHARAAGRAVGAAVHDPQGTGRSRAPTGSGHRTSPPRSDSEDLVCGDPPELTDFGMRRWQSSFRKGRDLAAILVAGVVGLRVADPARRLHAGLLHWRHGGQDGVASRPGHLGPPRAALSLSLAPASGAGAATATPSGTHPSFPPRPRRGCCDAHGHVPWRPVTTGQCAPGRSP